MQGDGLSGLLFVLALDPILRKLVEAVELGQGIHQLAAVRACADDIGATLAHLTMLARMAPTFADARSTTGLTLSPNKC